MTTVEKCRQALTQFEGLQASSPTNQQQASAVMSTVSTALSSLDQVLAYF